MIADMETEQLALALLNSASNASHISFTHSHVETLRALKLIRWDVSKSSGSRLVEGSVSLLQYGVAYVNESHRSLSMTLCAGAIARGSNPAEFALAAGDLTALTAEAS